MASALKVFLAASIVGMLYSTDKPAPTGRASRTGHRASRLEAALKAGRAQREADDIAVAMSESMRAARSREGGDARRDGSRGRSRSRKRPERGGHRIRRGVKLLRQNSSSDEEELVSTRGKRRRLIEGNEKSNNAQDDEDEFRKHVTKLFLNNRFSAKDTVLLVSKSTKAGARGVEDLAKSAKGGNHMKTHT